MPVPAVRVPCFLSSSVFSPFGVTALVSRVPAVASATVASWTTPFAEVLPLATLIVPELMLMFEPILTPPRTDELAVGRE